MLDLADGILPAVTFVWLGLVIYLLLLLRLRRAKELSSFRVLLGLSTSLSVLLAATIGLFYYLKHPVMNVQYVATDGFYSLFHICAINIPLTLSLLVALLSILPRTPRIARKRRTRHANYEHGTGSNSIL
jgi:branched-subunit amino acid ABC-type transport system permease component